MKKLIPLLLLLVVLAGCGPEGPITITTPGMSPTVSSFEADPPSIAMGGSSTLKWNVSGANMVSIDQGIGSVALSGSRVVMPATTTVYTLTATNAVGTSAVATAQVIVAGASTTPTPTPAAVPVINYFMANPPTMPVGGSTTLGWSVSNATSVTIDHGVGPVASAGTKLVSPSTSTSYILTATNSTGVVYMTAQVTVTGAPAAGIPDLVITDVSRSEDTITYIIKNQGDAVAGPSTSTLYVDTVLKANDSVGSLSPGESRTEVFAAYEYSCTLPSDSIEVRADTGSVLAESSEANNSYSESWSCVMAIGPIFVVKFPDLLVEDIWVVSEITGDKIYYKIKNVGAGDAPATISELYIYPCASPCPAIATDSVNPLAAGESRTEKFAAYNYTGGGWSVGVKVDTTGAAAEADEDNNSKSKMKADL